jgi:hypothetical protein
VKEGSKARKEEEAKEQPKGIGKSHDPLGNPFTFLRETINAWDNGKARCFASFAMA